ncbi:MAG: glycosyltransferase involved in cell wall biosynthesis [Clostridium sp.]|jgi:glycosyltransferase involved in cell wall biosynthesis
MKIAWFSPLPPLKSGISEYSELIVRHLKDCAHVDLWVSGFTPNSDLCNEFKVIDYSRDKKIWPMLKTYDAIVYNMGNNSDYHSNMYDVSLQYPGIVILHDYVLHHFFVGYWFNEKGNQGEYFDEIKKQYGSEIAEKALKSLQTPRKLFWEMEDMMQFPLNNSVIDNSKGVIVHSDFLKDLINSNSRDKAIKLDLPYYSSDFKGIIKNRTELKIPENKTIIAFFGFILPIKRIHKVLEVISKNKYLQDNVYILIIGEGGNPNYKLEEYINKYKLEDQVKTLGYLTIEEVYEYLQVVDICVNLRYPTMGETSASLIRFMELGKPTIVSNVGWYAELPDDSVVKIDIDKEENQLEYYLEKLIKDEDYRKKIGTNAENYVHKYYTPKNFVDGIVDFINTINQKSGEINYIHLLDKVSDILYEIGGNSKDIIPKVAREIGAFSNEQG